jgi:hypothetical protein
VSRGMPANADFVCDKAAELGDTIQQILCVI